MTDYRQEIGDLWRYVNRAIHERFRHGFRGSELPFGFLILIREIHHHPGITVSELARRAGMVKSHISKTVDQLVTQGIVEKRPDPDDQRLLRLYATEAAHSMKMEMESRARVVWNEVMAEVSDQDLEDVARGLRIMLQALDTANAKLHKERES